MFLKINTSDFDIYMYVYWVVPINRGNPAEVDGKFKKIACSLDTHVTDNELNRSFKANVRYEYLLDGVSASVYEPRRKLCRYIFRRGMVNCFACTLYCHL